jgi:hypothetical protein
MTMREIRIAWQIGTTTGAGRWFSDAPRLRAALEAHVSGRVDIEMLCVPNPETLPGGETIDECGYPSELLVCVVNVAEGRRCPGCPGCPRPEPRLRSWIEER